MAFLRFIPGFRTQGKLKMTFAVLYYISTLLLLFISRGVGLFFLAVPFFVFSLLDLIRYNKKSGPFSRKVLTFALALFVLIAGIANFPDTGPSKPGSSKTGTVSSNQTAAADQPGEKTQPTATNGDENNKGQEGDKKEAPDAKTEQPQENTRDAAKPSGSLEVHFIDVGQADSILVRTPDKKTMLIDAGNNADGNTVVSYIKKLGIDKVDILVGTHPHEDHIGGMDSVINSFDIGKIFMPKVSNTTKTFEDVLNAIKKKGLKISSPVPGSTFGLGEAVFTVFAPNSSSYGNLNNYSIVLKMQYGDTSFLFAGDAEVVSESEMIAKGYDLKADVLKIGHHGGNTSTTQAFLDKVNPKYAVIMVGAGNSYGHPHSSTMGKLKTKGIKVYRTDENGTVVAKSDGKNITFNTSPGSYAGGEDRGTNSPDPAPSEKNTENTATPSAPGDKIVYWTQGGKSYHYSKNCSTLARSKTILGGPLSECPKSDPCDVCTYQGN